MLTPGLIRSAPSDKVLFDILATELRSTVPAGAAPVDAYVEALRMLPVGLRAMGATYDLDVSLALDDLGWHFGNWHHKGLARETEIGLVEIGASEMATIFGNAFSKAILFWEELGQECWSSWYPNSPLEFELEALNKRAWEILEEKEMGLFSYWVEYARNHPERIV